MSEDKEIIAKNLAFYRKNAKLTQLELANKLNYSDKAISKWERGDSIPDVFILKQLADLYRIKVDDFMHVDKNGKPRLSLSKKFEMNRRALITVMSICFVWLFAVGIFVLFSLTGNNIIYPLWLVFIYALPLSSFVAMLFSIKWFKRVVIFIFASLLVWTLTLSIYISFINSEGLWLIFLIAVVVQILLIIWYFIIYINNKIKKLFK